VASSRSIFGGSNRAPYFLANLSARLTNVAAPTWLMYCSAPPVHAGKPMPKIEPMFASCTIETARCLQEGVLTTVHDANIGSIFGIGFPAWTGGALQFINFVGVKKFVARADELAKKFGERFA